MNSGFVLKFFIFILFFIGLNSSLYGAKLKSHQLQKLELVKKVALRYANKKGETFERTAMSICLTETNAGRVRLGDLGSKPNILNSSLGIMQVRLQTARFIAKKLHLKEIEDMSDVQLVGKLLGDDEFNVTIAVRYLVWLSEHTRSYFQMVSRYNGGNVNHPYYKKVVKNIQKIKNETALAW